MTTGRINQVAFLHDTDTRMDIVQPFDYKKPRRVRRSFVSIDKCIL